MRGAIRRRAGPVSEEFIGIYTAPCVHVCAWLQPAQTPRRCAIGLIIPGAGPAISGKVGGVVFAHNRYGQYARTHVIPTNPNTPVQASVRASFGALSNAWVTTLDDSERSGWALFAANVTFTNRIGSAINLTGNAAFVQANQIRSTLGLTVATDAPTIFALCSLNLGDAGTVTTTHAIWSFNTADDWDQNGGGLAIFLSPEQNPTINFYRGKFGLSGAFKPSGTATLTGGTVTFGGTLTAGNKVFWRAIASAPDGRPSASLNGVLVIP